MSTQIERLQFYTDSGMDLSGSEVVELAAEIDALTRANETNLASAKLWHQRADELTAERDRLREVAHKLWRWNCTEKGNDPNCKCPACCVYKGSNL